MTRWYVRILKSLALNLLKRILSYIDKDKDGKYSQEEIMSFVTEVRQLASKIKNKSF